MTQNNTRYAAYTGLFTTLIILGAFIKIPVPVIPFTLQFLFVSLAGLLLGAKYGGLSVFIYAALGLAGLPVFTAGGGITYVVFPTFGYIIGFIFSAFVSPCSAIAFPKKTDRLSTSAAFRSSGER